MSIEGRTGPINLSREREYKGDQKGSESNDKWRRLVEGQGLLHVLGQPEQTRARESHMGSTFTVIIIGLAAMLACAAFGLALGLRAPPPPTPAASRPTRPGGG